MEDDLLPGLGPLHLPEAFGLQLGDPSNEILQCLLLVHPSSDRGDEAPWNGDLNGLAVAAPQILPLFMPEKAQAS
jgi:hypothetical protein